MSTLTHLVLPSDEEWLRRAIQTANEAVEAGSAPFAGLVVHNGELMGVGLNRVRQDCDPTAHAEVVAIRNACRHLASTTLHGSTLYASGEPCSMCMVSAAWAGVRRVVFAASAEVAAAAGFDYLGSRQLLAPWSSWAMEIIHLPLPEATEPFERKASGARDKSHLTGE